MSRFGAARRTDSSANHAAGWPANVFVGLTRELELEGVRCQRAESEGAASDKPQPAGDKKGNQKKERDPENQQSLTGLLLGFLAKPDDGSGEERPVIRTPEDYYALVDEERRRAGALPEPAPAEKNERRVS